MVIPNVIANSAGYSSRAASSFGIPAKLFLIVLNFVLSFALLAQATDWSAPEQELARKIVSLTGSGPVSLTFENRSSLASRDAEIVKNGLRSALSAMGVRIVQNDPATTALSISLSENLTSYVWVAQIQKSGTAPSVVMVSVARPQIANGVRESVPLSLRKLLVWSQAEPILDVAVLEENGGTSRIAVLSAEKVSIYRIRNGSSQLEAVANVAHSKPWPRDLRGRIFPVKDHLLDVYLPGVTCRSSASGTFELHCHEANDPWPLMIAAASGVPSASSNVVRGFFETSRNFFSGIAAADGQGLKTVPPFYSAAAAPRENSLLWIFAGVDGQVHIVDGTAERVAKLNWGSEITTVRTSCGAGWQVLATSGNGDEADSIRAFEIPGLDPVAVSSAVDFSGPISALWTEEKGDTAIAIARSGETGNYEAFRLAMACGQ